MKMPKKLKTKWVKALRSGEFEQAADTLCDGKGGFCCLGVLEYVAMDGEVETKGKSYANVPTIEFYDYAGIEVDIGGYTRVVIDNQLDDLVSMNDETDYETGEHYNTFKDIANYIEKNIETI